MIHYLTGKYSLHQNVSDVTSPYFVTGWQPQFKLEYTFYNKKIIHTTLKNTSMILYFLLSICKLRNETHTCTFSSKTGIAFSSRAKLPVNITSSIAQKETRKLCDAEGTAALWETLATPCRRSRLRQNILCNTPDKDSAHPYSPINWADPCWETLWSDTICIGLETPPHLDLSGGICAYKWMLW